VKRFGVAFLVLALIFGLRFAFATDAGAVHRIGFLTRDAPAIHGPYAAAFGKGLAEGGYIEGRNVIVERRFTEFDPGAIQRLLAELMRLEVEVLVMDSTPAALAAKDATRTIPIVTLSGDPVAAGLVASLGRPGGNVTALTTMGPGIVGKRLALLKEIAPRTHRVGVLWNPDNQSGRLHLEGARAVAADLGLELHLVSVRRREDIDRVLGALAHVDAIMMAEDALVEALLPRVGTFAIQNRLPVLCSYRVPGDSSCLLWYGPDIFAMYQQLGLYTARVLDGSKPAELPVEQPTKLSFVINAKTARALGIAIPQSLQVMADDVIR
jgi:putative ABC transport system substrate-binding protein